MIHLCCEKNSCVKIQMFLAFNLFPHLVPILGGIEDTHTTGQRHALGTLQYPSHLLEQAVVVPEALRADSQVDAPEEPVPVANEAAFFRP